MVLSGVQHRSADVLVRHEMLDRICVGMGSSRSHWQCCVRWRNSAVFCRRTYIWIKKKRKQKPVNIRRLLKMCFVVRREYNLTFADICLESWLNACLTNMFLVHKQDAGPRRASNSDIKHDGFRIVDAFYSIEAVNIPYPQQQELTACNVIRRRVSSPSRTAGWSLDD